MIGKFNYEEKQVAIVGGGIAGLLAAHFLARDGFHVSLFEKSERLGGLIRSDRGGRGLIEHGPHSLMQTPELLDLCQNHLHLPLVALEKAGHKKFIYRDGRLRTFPLQFKEVVEMLWRASFAKARPAMGPGLMYDWAVRHLGVAAAQYLIEPMITGIYGANARDISVDAAFPHLLPKPGTSLFFGRNRQRGGGKRIIVSFQRGVAELVDRLTESLQKNPRFKLFMNSEMTELPDSPNIVLATPAAVAGALIQSKDALLATALAQVRYSPLISATIFLRRAGSLTSLKGIGVLIPPIENRKILGVLFNSVAFPGRVEQSSAVVSVTVLMGGQNFEALAQLKDEELIGVIRAEFDYLPPLKACEILEWSITRYRQAIPVYSKDLIRLWQIARQGWCAVPGQMLFGNYTGEVSIRGMLSSAASLLPAK
jgi:oxygen-dependent protoporphyrinogen oxidase